MATENQQHDENATPSLSARGAARRRLTQAGAGALLTIGSRGALANAPSCLTPSGYWSSGLNPANSHHSHNTCQGGRSPGYWKQAQHPWPGGIDPATFMFSAAFPMPGAGTCPVRKNNGLDANIGQPGPTSYECAYLLEILSPQGFDTSNLGMHMAATYLNIQAGLINFLTVEQLRQMWNDVTSPGGIFHPTAGVNWDRTAVVKYLYSTMI